MATADELSAEDKRAFNLGALLLRRNPDIAKKAKRLAKEADPTLVVPEIELEDQIAAAGKANREEIDKLVAKNLEMEARERRRNEAEAARAEGLDPAAVEKIVTEEKCSFSTARKFLKAQAATAEPGPGEVLGGNNPAGTPIDLRPEKEVRKLSGNDLRRWSAGLAHSMIDQFRGQRRAATR